MSMVKLAATGEHNAKRAVPDAGNLMKWLIKLLCIVYYFNVRLLMFVILFIRKLKKIKFFVSPEWFTIFYFCKLCLRVKFIYYKIHY